MLKLYRQINGKTEYWETWDNNKKSGIIHWGFIGEKGQDKEVTSTIFNNFHKIIQNEIDEMMKKGFKPVEEEYLKKIIVEYEINGHGNTNDLEKIQKLEDRLNQTLGWTGLGHCDGNSIGSGTMEVCSYVVDFNISKKVIEDDLKDTEFQDYSKIYEEE